MTAEKAAYRVLVASASDKMASVVKDVLPGPQYRDISYVSTMGDAKRMLVSQTYDILIINTPLKDDFGIQAAVDIAEQHETGILLLVKAEMYEQVSSLYTSVKMLSAVQMKIRKLEKEMRRMKERMQEQQTIDRAKWLLVDQRKMSEPDAHRYIEKAAMDRCVKKIRIAEEILREN